MTINYFDRVPRPRVFEETLWAAADKMRAKSKLKSSEYAAPLLGLFFLRYATNRVTNLTPQVQAELARTAGSRLAEPEANIYTRLAGFTVPPEAHYDQRLLTLAGSDNAQQAVIDAMVAFEKANPEAGITLPKNDYRKIPDEVLRDIIGKVAEINVAEGDVFGKIYEYFLGKFALSEGQKGGEFFTPTTVVRFMVELLEPHAGRILDPACGTGGMFVQSDKFLKAHGELGHLSIYGQEQKTETAMLARLNLFVNGLKADIREVNSSLSAAAYADDYADTFGKFDFVMANPPFNVKEVTTADTDGNPLLTTYGPTLVTSGKKVETYSNANYLWISLFATALNPEGRAGFVMANSASDARGAEAEARAKLVNAGLVDVMVTVASNFFYTVTLPVTLWFLDRAKTEASHPRHDQVLFIDARRTYHQITRALREFTQAQQLNLAAIVWLHRGEHHKFTELRAAYATAADRWHDTTVTDPDFVPARVYHGVTHHRAATAKAYSLVAARLHTWIINSREFLADDARAALAAHPTWEADVAELLALTPESLPPDKPGLAALHQRTEALVTFADRELRPARDRVWATLDFKGSLRRAADERDQLQFVLDRVAYFHDQVAWLDDHFPDATYRDVEGLCYRATRAEIAEQQYSLNPGRYVGVALEDDGRTPEEFREFVQGHTATLTQLHAEADTLQAEIAQAVGRLFMDAEVGREVGQV